MSEWVEVMPSLMMLMPHQWKRLSYMLRTHISRLLLQLTVYCVGLMLGACSTMVISCHSTGKPSPCTVDD